MLYPIKCMITWEKSVMWSSKWSIACCRPGHAFSGDYHEYFFLNTDTESVVYLMLANHILRKLYPDFMVTIAEVSTGFCMLLHCLDQTWDWQCTGWIHGLEKEFRKSFMNEHVRSGHEFRRTDLFIMCVGSLTDLNIEQSMWENVIMNITHLCPRCAICPLSSVWSRKLSVFTRVRFNLFEQIGSYASVFSN